MSRRVKSILGLSLFILFLFYFSLFAQTKVFRAIEYHQLTHFETFKSIASMKMSADGTNIVFSTSGGEVKVYTMNINGSNLKMIYDFNRTGFGPSVDINSAGTLVTWCDGFGEIYVSDIDGTMLYEVATLLLNPNTAELDIEPEIPLPPRMTVSGEEIFFIHTGRDPLAAGVWRVGYDGKNLKQIFSYSEMSNKVFGRDGSEYNFNTAFTDGFDINGDGSRMILGTRTFKIEGGDFVRGDATVLDNGTFYKLGDYALGNQPFATCAHGDVFIMFKREFNAELGDDEINVYFTHIGTGEPIKVISGLDIFGTANMLEMDHHGSYALVHGGGGIPFQPPITRVHFGGKDRFDLVNVDEASLVLGGFRMSEAQLPSMNMDGDVFCFVAPSNPPQIWSAHIKTDGINSEPSVTNVKFDPDYIHADMSTTTTFSAKVSSINGPIQTVQFSAFKDGAFQSRAITANWPGTLMVDDGTLGDEYADDQVYTRSGIRKDLAEVPNGPYTVRLVATDGLSITAVDAEPFTIKEGTSSVEKETKGPNDFQLFQNQPNPFNPNTKIKYTLSKQSNVKMQIYNIQGHHINTLVNEKQNAGVYTIPWNGKDHTGKTVPTGLYICRIKAGNFNKHIKMMYIR